MYIQLSYLYRKRTIAKYKAEGIEFSQAELELSLEEYGSKEVLGDYMQISILFGFMVCMYDVYIVCECLVCICV